MIFVSWCVWCVYRSFLCIWYIRMDIASFTTSNGTILLISWVLQKVAMLRHFVKNSLIYLQNFLKEAQNLCCCMARMPMHQSKWCENLLKWHVSSNFLHAVHTVKRNEQCVFTRGCRNHDLPYRQGPVFTLKCTKSNTVWGSIDSMVVELWLYWLYPSKFKS